MVVEEGEILRETLLNGFDPLLPCEKVHSHAHRALFPSSLEIICLASKPTFYTSLGITVY